MKYINWLKNKNLSKSTITIYNRNFNLWKHYLNERKPTKKLFVKFINDYSNTHKPRSVRLLYSSILSILKFEKQWKLLNECRDIRLPQVQYNLKNIITLNEYLIFKEKYILTNWYKNRNFLIFSMLFYTGLRVAELLEFNKKHIYDKNKIVIKGKGNKSRVIYINDELLKLLNEWKANRVSISKQNKLLTKKQINIIVKNIGQKYFNKIITPHSLRRSYATNLLRSNVNLEIVRKILGHSNINTTSRYIQYTDDEMINEISKLLKSS